MVGIRLVDGAFRRFNDQSIAAVRGILRRTTDASIIVGAVGAILGSIAAFIAELIAGEKLGGVAKGVVLGTITGIASGAIAAIAVAIVRNITVPAITKMSTDHEIKTLIVISIMGAFVGGIFGGNILYIQYHGWKFGCSHIPHCNYGYLYSSTVLKKDDITSNK